MSPDWSASPTPIPYASLTNPQSFNLYAYTTNNPLSSVDPSGHDGCQLEGIDTDCNGLSNNEGAAACPNNNCDPYFDWSNRRFMQFSPTEDDPSRTLALTDPLADPNVFNQATQGCLVDRINSMLQGSGVQVDIGSYTTQGGHAEFGLTAIASSTELTNAGLSFYSSPFGPNGYRDTSFFNSMHVNGSGYELHDLNTYPTPATKKEPSRTLPVTDAQAHFDSVNSAAGHGLGSILHGVVDVVGGTILGGTSLDPRCP